MPEELRAITNVLHLKGRVEFSQLRELPRVGQVAVQGELRSLVLPGIDLQWKHGLVDLCVRERTIALATGRARRGGHDDPHDEAARWLDRYERVAERAPADVGGGFSVVIIDLAAKSALLFVDRFAIETLCYRHDHGVLSFSNAAVDVGGERKMLDPQALYDYLYFHVIPAPQTAFGEVRRLQGAQRAMFSATAAKAETYWDPQFVETDRSSLDQRMREFVDIVQRCVEEEADDARTACFLSGGTDSSTIAGMLRRLRGEPVHAYSIGFDAAGYDEMAYARIAARHFQLEHHEYYVTPDDLVDAIPKLAAFVDQPFGNSSVLPAYYCALQARRDGFTRLLAGDGGDELFGGNSRYAVQKLFHLYHALPLRLRRQLLEPAATEWSLFRRVPGFRQLGGYVRHSRLPMPDRLDTFNLLQRLGDAEILDPQFLARVDIAGPLHQRRLIWNMAKAGSLVNRMLAYDWKFTLADNDLPKVRTATQLAGLTTGYPLLGRALTDFSLTLPPEWKVKRMQLRWFFKRALRGFLPREILRKQKHGFGLPFGAWVLRHSALRDLVQGSLDGIARRGIVRSDFASRLLTDQLPEAPGYYGEMVWILMMLEQWLRSHETVTIPDLLPSGGSVHTDAVHATIRTVA